MFIGYLRIAIWKAPPGLVAHVEPVLKNTKPIQSQ